MSEKKNYTSLPSSNNVIEISELKFNALIAKEVVEYMINDEIKRKSIKHKNVLYLEKWLSKHNKLKNETSILCNVLKRYKINSNHEPFQKNTTNLLEINTHNQQALNENTLKNSQKNPKMITVIEDKLNFKILIQKPTDTKPMKTKEKNDYTIIDTIVIDDSDDEVDVIDNFKETTLRYEPSQKSSTKNVSGGRIRFSNELKPVIDKAQTSIIKKKKLSKTKDSQHPKLKSMIVDEGNNCMNNANTQIRGRYKPGPKSKTKDSFYNLEAIPTVLNDYQGTSILDVKVVKPKTINTSNFISTQESKKLKKYNTNFKIKGSNYPPPYPIVPPHNSQPSWKMVPLAPILTIELSTLKKKTITLTWDMKLTSQIAIIQQYELYSCQETEKVPDTSMWKLIGTIEANELPMQCELDSFKEGFTYHFALRAVDIYQRRGPCSVGKISI